MECNTEMTLGFNGKVVILASGSGSNAEALMKKATELGVEVCTVISDKAGAGVIERAKKNNVPSVVIEAQKGSFTDPAKKEEHEKRVIEEIESHAPSYILLAGYMRIFSQKFIEHFLYQDGPLKGLSKIINIHPSLLPSFKGKDAYEQAFESGVKISGSTLHFIDHNVDEGSIIDQRSYERLPKDNLSDFKTRGLALEHEMYTEFLEALVQQRVNYRFTDKKVYFWINRGDL